MDVSSLIGQGHNKFRLESSSRPSSTILAEPHWSRVDDTGGQLVNQYGAGLALLMDKELIPNRLIAAFNLLYDPEVKKFQDTGSGRARPLTASVQD
jgi:hypothetical protein